MSEKCYKSLDLFYKENFGEKVFKVSLDAGFSCPNKDGLKGRGGCIFCNGSVAIGDKREDLIAQFESVKEVLHKKWPKAKYIAFLEANTNTYADVDTLKKIYEPLIRLDGVVGLSIATRCDAISEEVYDYLEDLNKRTFLSIELGLQSAHDATLKYLNRGHTVSEFTECVKELRGRGIDVVVHIINGLAVHAAEGYFRHTSFLHVVTDNEPDGGQGVAEGQRGRGVVVARHLPGSGHEQVFLVLYLFGNSIG